MAKTTVDQLIAHAESLLGSPYIFGYKGQKATAKGINVLSHMYPGVFTKSYVNKALLHIGKRCYDCSGLISSATGVLRGSTGYFASATKRVKITGKKKLDNKYRGWILWKNGHVGIYAGDNVCYEARGIDYGTVKTKANGRGFDYLLQCPDVDYSVPAKPNPNPKPKKPSYRYKVRKWPDRFSNPNSRLTVRKLPSKVSKKLRYVNQGYEFTSTKRIVKWLYVDALKGWVAAKYCKKI